MKDFLRILSPTVINGEEIDKNNPVCQNDNCKEFNYGLPIRDWQTVGSVYGVKCVCCETHYIISQSCITEKEIHQRQVDMAREYAWQHFAILED